MISGRMSAVAEQLRGELTGGDGTFLGISTDTRSLQSGQLFVALRGPNFDGNAFVAEARDRGAAGALVSVMAETSLPQVRVPDTLHGLGSLASGWRRQFDLTVIGVTGSAGKTTVKEMIAAVLSGRAQTLATRGNLNNEIGVPLTLCELSSDHRLAVIEMGANHQGEIRRLCALARPDIGVVTLAGASHLEGFGSVEGVARAKGELFESLQPDGTAVINADDTYAGLWREMCGADRIVTFGHGPAAEVTARNVDDRAGQSSSFRLVTPIGSVQVSLPLPGRHNVTNALAASAVAMAAGADVDEIATGLSRVRGVAGRLQVRPGLADCRLIDDTYNANPGSMRVAIDFLTGLDGQAWAVLGDMGELGEEGPALHREVGEYARSLGVERIFCIGALSRETATGFGEGAQHFMDPEALLDELHRVVGPDINLLIKGSRMMRLEQVVAGLTRRPEREAAGGGC